jgi:lipopolysaccharide/colanic/teichoic acid biosynthesis glycosyltransferase
MRRNRVELIGDTDQEHFLKPSRDLAPTSVAMRHFVIPHIICKPRLFSKEWVDLALAIVILVPSLPIIALLIVFVRAVSKGPGIYSQQRVGLGGKTFTLYKIRTMHDNAEAETGPIWCFESDQRLIPFGHILRATHLDELPQLFNVIAGQMSLVGPRPERPEFFEQLTKEIPNYMDRLVVRPGITGLAQVTHGPDRNTQSVREKLRLDKIYIESMGVSLDVRIIFCTALQFFRVPHTVARAVTALSPLSAPAAGS